MSRQNKVNPGMYTQRGRLTQDDAAREISKQRSVGSEHTWQPVQRDQEPRLTSESADEEEDAAKPPSAKKTAARKTPGASARSTVRAKAKSAPRRKS